MTTKPIDLVMFAGVDIAGNNNLWVTNGTASGTHELTGISGADTNRMWLRCLTSTSLAVSQTNREHRSRTRSNEGQFLAQPSTADR
jgi:hypothetical protein